MSKVKVVFIKHITNHYGLGLSDFQVDVVKQVHQCDLALMVPVTQPMEGVEYPNFEVKTFEAKEQSFVDSYENEIEYLNKLNNDLSGQIGRLKWDRANKVSAWYKTLFYTVLISFLAASVVLLTK